MNIATLVEKLPTEHGDTRRYQMTPPCLIDGSLYDCIVVSSSAMPFSEPEAWLFYGETGKKWVARSPQAGNHTAILREMGYTLVEQS